ncbi:MAG: hypothetical protein CSA42_00810 [Gammaproteobacteria bacterium]|nr:MAG: hypothetical protein CSA42_00810 [Gammaproteobacteria bacterium]
MSNLNSKNKSNNNFAAIYGALGLSMLTTTAAVTAHHFWRKRNNPNAQLSDYLEGVTDQLKRIEQANKSWLKSYQGFNDAKEGLVDSHQTAVNNQQPSQSNKKQKVKWVSGVANKTIAAEFDDFSVVGIAENRQIIWQTSVPERVHDIVVQPVLVALSKYENGKKLGMNSAPTIRVTDGLLQTPAQHIAVMGRRPSEYFWVMDCTSGKLVYTIKAKDLNKENNRHFYGHACYSLDGNLLYVAENDTKTFAGIIGVYDVHNGYQKIAEFATHGIGPHELILHPDGDKLVIANGGIKTERASREELNLATMQPSLVYLSLTNGEEGKVLQQIKPKHNQMSVRHISSITEGNLKGTVAIGIQFQGEKHLNMPLVLTHKFGDTAFIEYSTNNGDVSWRQFHHYIASVMVNSKSNLICATSPIGGCVSVFDMVTQKMIDTVKIADCAGIAVADDGFIVSDGKGGLTWLKVVEGKLEIDRVMLPMAFDNHMQVVES